ncbi:ATP-binding domain-containing protein [Tabrizicola sp.]|uniref:ATP-binding domain-containing protein n=1 Tax=Tabrizicola sp. TaxID=2005166 RepID=UPI0035B2B849
MDLIAEDIASLTRELGNKTTPVPDAIEWLAEWAQNIRTAQRGLLLLTAHRSKGLEFDHVVILNGGWQALSKGEDGEAPRRLFYVAMTRARRSLSVVTSGSHAFVRADSESELLRKVETPPGDHLPDLDQYILPDLSTVDLSYAGRLPDTSSTHAAIAAAQVAYPRLEAKGAWANVRKLGAAGANASFSGKVGAVVCWRKQSCRSSCFGKLKTQHTTAEKDQLADVHGPYAS